MSMTHHLRTVLIGVFLARATLVAAVGITRHHSGTDPTPRGPYVALGDSCTAGPRIPDRTGAPAGCDRSDHDYPALVAERLGLRAADFRDVSYVSGDTDDVQRKIDTAGERLSEALAEVKRRAPKARLFVVGYPAILPAHGTGCADDLTLAPADATYLNDKEQQLNAVLGRRAQGVGAGYVDTYELSVGRDACSGRDTRWIEPLLPSLPAGPMHPDERGARSALRGERHPRRTAREG
ncbi:SGNH/GDSL hydrolase family protein [Streptomyces mirabilis]|uniref:SGNH/GDSL hydrolase family protein n=1 Tax=Streptomyces mirabilis TaxID=68239 RepID=UPI0031B9CD06